MEYFGEYGSGGCGCAAANGRENDQDESANVQSVGAYVDVDDASGCVDVGDAVVASKVSEAIHQCWYLVQCNPRYLLDPRCWRTLDPSFSWSVLPFLRENHCHFRCHPLLPKSEVTQEHLELHWV